MIVNFLSKYHMYIIWRFKLHYHNASSLRSAALHHFGHQPPVWAPQARLDVAQVGAHVRAYDLTCDLPLHELQQLGAQTSDCFSSVWLQKMHAYQHAHRPGPTSESRKMMTLQELKDHFSGSPMPID